jgi:hypothetical protein
MINRLFDAMFTPKYPKGYTGRHRAQLAFVKAVTPARVRSNAQTAIREATI